MNRRAFLSLLACALPAAAPWPKCRGLWLSPPWRSLPAEPLDPGLDLAFVTGSPAALAGLAARLTPSPDRRVPAPPCPAPCWLLAGTQQGAALALGARRCPTDAAFAEAGRALRRDWYGG